ncbi:ISL3 family transposase [Streptomyces sp. YIM 121038]|uniref:ISL3 family transposase n=1 Tax=Streptomyces sp. YIM 121038 TaxID=2136401 RepID=UPI001485D105|nr:ISL3 family transposase [Streptomyces sp. YIM 121038]
MAVEGVLFPGINVRIVSMRVAAEVVAVEALACGRPPLCPSCGRRGMRGHSRYVRRLAERPLVGRPLVVHLKVRRFFCESAACRRRTFVEQVPDLSERYRRATAGLRKWLRAIAAGMGGRPGERMCRRLQVTAGRTQLLGLLQAPAVPARAPRVLGVDEFAFRRRWRYGTVLVDVEAHRVVDVLPDRDAATFSSWLREHPGAEIICRDRASAYSSAIREAAPDAQEIADRWHLLHNLSSAVEKTCHQHRPCLRKHTEAEQESVTRPVVIPLPAPVLPPPKIAVRTRDRYADIHRLLDAGYSLSAISRRLHLDRKTVRRFRDTDLRLLLASARHGRPKGVLEPFTGYLTERFTEGCTSRHPAPSRDPATRLPGHSNASAPLPEGTADRDRGTGPRHHPQPAQDHVMDHAAARHSHGQRGGAVRVSQDFRDEVTARHGGAIVRTVCGRTRDGVPAP